MSHASGVVPSAELLEKFAKAREADSSVRFIKAQIDELQVAVTAEVSKAGDQTSDFGLMSQHLEGDTPCYMLFRLDEAQPPSNWLLAMYVPENAKVRLKMLYASTREALKNELGASYFASEMHASELDEMSYENYQRSSVVSDAERLSLMSEAEKMKAKDMCNSHMDTGISKSSYVHGVKFAMSSEASSSLGAFKAKEVNFVRLRIDTSKEVIDLEDSQMLQGGFAAFKDLVISSEQPRFCLYSYDATEPKQDVFILYCPDGVKVKEKMMYSTSKAGIVGEAEEAGIVFDKKLEIRESSDLLESELVATAEAAEPAAPAVAKPKGPGGKRGLIKVPVLPQ